MKIANMAVRYIKADDPPPAVSIFYQDGLSQEWRVYFEVSSHVSLIYSTLLVGTSLLSAGRHQDHVGFPTLFHFLGRRRAISEGGHLNKAGHEFAPFTRPLFRSARLLTPKQISRQQENEKNYVDATDGN
jgi:hypothetical protein